MFHPQTRKEIADRKPGQKVACQTGAGCPKGTPETAHEKEFNDRTRRIVETYRAVQAGIAPPYNDGIARYVFAFLSQIYQRIDDQRTDARLVQMMFGAGPTQGRRR